MECRYSPFSEGLLIQGGRAPEGVIVEPVDVAGYTRVSLEEQASLGFSLDSQDKRYVDIVTCTILILCIFLL